MRIEKWSACHQVILTHNIFDIREMIENRVGELHRLCRCDVAVAAAALEIRPGFIFVRTLFVQKGKCSPFLKLTPSLRQMPQDITNIHEE